MSTPSVPASHLEDAQKLEADGIVELFEIQLASSGRLYLKNDNAVTYQGNNYEQAAMQITGVGKSADESVSRPQLSVVNIDGIFTASVMKGDLDRALVIRRRVLYDDLVNDRAVYTEQSWNISRVVSLNKHVAVFELRGQLDGQVFMVPPRMFMPPDFPQVSLS